MTIRLRIGGRLRGGRPGNDQVVGSRRRYWLIAGVLTVALVGSLLVTLISAGLAAVCEGPDCSGDETPELWLAVSAALLLAVGVVVARAVRVGRDDRDRP
jgi:hypothetical protein